MARHRHDPTGTAGGVVIRVAIADDQALVRAGFVSLLDAADDITVVGEARDGAEAVALARTARPDIVLMDVRMPGVDGIEATRRIVGDPDLKDVKVVVLTTYEVDEYVFQALRAGASGFLTKDVEPDDLRAAVRTIAEGNALLTPSVTRRVVNAFAATPQVAPDRSRLAVLSERERDVLALVGQGLSNQEIAERLYMSPLTAKTHVSRIMQKLGVRDRAQLVVVAFQTGLASV
jgi:DNA-binding NarL/FixJ family response regulator